MPFMVILYACTHLNIASMDDDVGASIQVVEVSIMPTNLNDPAYSMHRCFMHGAFQYIIYGMQSKYIISERIE